MKSWLDNLCNPLEHPKYRQIKFHLVEFYKNGKIKGKCAQGEIACQNKIPYSQAQTTLYLHDFILMGVPIDLLSQLPQLYRSMNFNMESCLTDGIQDYIFRLNDGDFNYNQIAEFLRTGGYDRSLRNLRTKYESQLSIASKYLSEYFPDGTKLSKPQGGFFLWVELPKQINSIELQREAIKKKITIAPGPLFSTHKGYENYIRISCGFPLTPVIKDAIKTLGNIAKRLM